MDLLRAMITSSPMMGAVDLSQIPGRPGAFAFDHPIQFIVPQPPVRRPGAIVTIDTLRRLADGYDVLRSCIEHLKREVSAVPFEIVPKDKKDKSEATRKRIQDAMLFFTKGGGLGGVGRRRREFEFQMLEDLCVIGAAALFFRENRGGTLYEVDVIDAATIRPRVDAFGWPGPTEEVYEQYIEGIKVAGFTRRQMSYDGIYPVSNSPYYKSPVEWLLNVLNAAMRADDWNLSWLTDGNTPSDMIALPENWGAETAEKWIQRWGQYYGDSKARQQVKWVPGGSQRVGNPSRKDNDFQQFMLWLLQRTCSLMGVQPASIGYPGEQYKVSQEDSMDSTSTFGAGVLLEYRKDAYDEILERNGYVDLETQNITSREEKASERAKKNKDLVGGGIKKINEARADEGLDPDPDGDVLLVPITLQPLEFALNPPEPAGADGGDPTDTVGGEKTKADTSRALADLRAWERKARNRVKQNKGADCEFRSEHIARAIMDDISERLGACQTGEDVQRVFHEARESERRTPSREVARSRPRITRKPNPVEDWYAERCRARREMYERGELTLPGDDEPFLAEDREGG